jgi:NADH-quinone oxidoreductase subunit L
MVDPANPIPSYALQGALVLPVVGILVLFFGGRLRSGLHAAPGRWPGFVAVAAVACSLLLSTIAASGTRDHHSISMQGGDWLPGFGPAFSFQLDWLSSWILMLVEIVGLMVTVFSLGYMREERDQRRYFGALLFFTAMMKLLITSASYLLLFAGWEGVGLASYLLIGYHFERPKAAQAATKAFIVNRIGDAGLILGVMAIALTCGSTTFAAVAGAAAHISHGTVQFICAMLILGAVGKSAQFPLHIWLPDAMEGPTPVSALIHSATMVCAGVYLLARSNFLFLLAPEVGMGAAVLGAITAVFAASVALVEDDIKRVLAYSTISQIGFMFIALGIGADRAAMYHVVTHAFFKSLLFLGAGSIIHALHGEQSLKRMGGLRREMPVTFWCMTIASLSLAGLPGLSGYFSKDLILEAGVESGHIFVTVCGILTTLLTALYSWRLMSLAFLGEPRASRLAPHPPSASMTWPMMTLAACCIVVGLGFVPVRWSAWGVMIGSGLLACAGLALAWFYYVFRPEARNVLDRRFAGLAKLLRNRWFIDAVFEEHFIEHVVLRTAEGAAAADMLLIDGSVRGTAALSRSASAALGWSDRFVIDGIVRTVSGITRFLSWPSRALQSGYVQTYALLFLVGVLAALGYCLSR